MEKIQGALIDMDGVLYDSMPGHTLAWWRMMTEAGFDVPRDEFYLYEGMTGHATIRMLYRRDRGADVSEEECRRLYARKSAYFSEWGEPPLMPGTADVLRILREKGAVCVLVTGSGQQSLLDRVRSDYPGIFADGHMVTSRDVTHGKPDPEPYLKGAEIAGVSPGNWLVVENAPLGVVAGKRAGAFVCAVTTGPIPRDEFVKAGADMIFGNMHEFAAWLDKNLVP